MSELMKFDFENKQVRTVQIDNRPWWVGKDVCGILGYANHRKAMNDHCRGVTKSYAIADSLGRMQETRVINEPDLYRLVGGSHLPEAKRFESWIYEEVIPSVMHTGKYVAEGEQVVNSLLFNSFIKDYTEMSRLVYEQKAVIEQVIPTMQDLAKAAPRILFERASLREENRHLKEEKRLTEQFAKKGTPLTREEKELTQVLFKAHCSIPAIAHRLNRGTESAIRSYLKTLQRGKRHE